MGHALRDFGVQTVGIGAVIVHIFGAHFGGNREPGRDRQADIGHFGEIGPFAAEQVAGFCLARWRAIRVHAATETIYILGHSSASSLSNPSFSKEGQGVVYEEAGSMPVSEFCEWG